MAPSHKNPIIVGPSVADGYKVASFDALLHATFKAFRKNKGIYLPQDLVEDNQELKKAEEWVINHNPYLFLLFHQRFDEIAKIFHDKKVYPRINHNLGELRREWQVYAEQERQKQSFKNFVMTMRNDSNFRPEHNALNDLNYLLQSSLSPINVLHLLKQEIVETKINMHHEHIDLLHNHHENRQQRIVQLQDVIQADNSISPERRDEIIAHINKYHEDFDNLFKEKQAILKRIADPVEYEKKLAEFKEHAKQMNDEFGELLTELAELHSDNEDIAAALNAEIEIHDKFNEDYALITSKAESKIKEIEAMQTGVKNLLVQQLSNDASKISSILAGLDVSQLPQEKRQLVEQAIQNIDAYVNTLSTQADSAAFYKTTQDLLIQLKSVKPLLKEPLANAEVLQNLARAENALKEHTAYIEDPQIKFDMAKLTQVIDRAKVMVQSQSVVANELPAAPQKASDMMQSFREKVSLLKPQLQVNSENEHKILFTNVHDFLQKMIKKGAIDDESIDASNDAINLCSELKNQTIGDMDIEKISCVLEVLKNNSDLHSEIASFAGQTEELISAVEAYQSNNNHGLQSI